MLTGVDQFEPQRAEMALGPLSLSPIQAAALVTALPILPLALRSISPMPPMPANINIQMEGSGTPETTADGETTVAPKMSVS
jgi:hypothetical protein